MLTKRIIPCLDVKDGRVVKGTKFVNLRDAGDPALVASQYNEEGADEVTFLDITASSEKRKILIDVVERTADRIFMPLTVGGGIKNLQEIRELLLAGADKISVNTKAVENPSFIQQAAEKFGSQCIVVAIDAKRVVPKTKKWRVYTHGGRKETKLDAVQWAKRVEKLGAGEILLTSMDRDGTREGYDIELTRAVSEAVSIPVVASGGAGNPGHILEALTKGEANAVIVASIFHFRNYRIEEVKEFLWQHDVPVRL
ncbi:MAG: imidazole glycerol phosphate synthase subunit HisF [Deltaproteobacteria bacterium]|nr:imidazole glycerol phosphate synthase subunit HisF [Deltaproteobacteria bacterium]